MKRAALCIFGIAALAWLPGCKTGPRFDAPVATEARLAALSNLTTVAVTNRVDPAWLQTPAERFTLGPGDRLEIEIVGDPTTRTAATVGPDGKIYFNLLAGIDVWGRTLPEARALIEGGMAQFLREPPRVSLTLRGVESHRIWLLGRLNTPGIYPMPAPMTLLEALTAAGGPTSPAAVASPRAGTAGLNYADDVADLRRSFVIRNGQILPVDFYRLLKEGDMAQNIYLRADDFVYVPSRVAREIFVLGAVLQPKSVLYRERLSMVAAIGQAEGTIKDAYLSHVAIVRGSLTQPKIAVVDYNAVTRGESPDVLLEPGDIVYVPFSPYRTLERYAMLILNTFVSTVAINEGAHAVTRNAQPVGVAFGGGVVH